MRTEPFIRMAERLGAVRDPEDGLLLRDSKVWASRRSIFLPFRDRLHYPDEVEYSWNRSWQVMEAIGLEEDIRALHARNQAFVKKWQ